MMFKISWLVVASLSLLLLSGCQTQVSALLPSVEPMGYEEEHDLYIVFGGQHFQDVGTFLPVKLVGELAFDLQEGTHRSIRHVGVAELNYYYIWLCLGDSCIPVDPFRVGMS